jgi:hypothetical protein
MDKTWVRGPVGPDARHRVTREGCHNVLVMIPTLAAGTRLMDLIALLEADHRIQTSFTVPCADETCQYTEEFVRSHGGLALPWHQAKQHTWDLILTASHRHIEQAHGRILILPHGAGNIMSRRYSRKAGTPTSPTTGLDAELLTFRGRVIPAAIALAHEPELRTLRRTCPQAAHTGVVAGDICLDRMSISVAYRQRYRAALAVHNDQRLITISSTWSADSLFGRHPHLYARIVKEARDNGSAVAAVLHPQIWAVHGEWQVRAWLAEAIQLGLMLIPPHRGWQATMIASDHVIGDHGSTACYAAAIGRPVHLATFPDGGIRAESPAGALGRCAPRLDHGQPILPQLRPVEPFDGAAVADAITSSPGAAGGTLRTTMYRLLEISEPPWPAAIDPVPSPRPIRREGHDEC